MNRKNTIRIILAFVIVLFSTGLFMAYKGYRLILSPNTSLQGASELYIHIPTGSSLQDVTNILSAEAGLIDKSTFHWVAQRKKYRKVKAGRYKIRHGMNNNQLVNLLRSGRQEPVQVTFNNVETIEKLASKVAKQIEADSSDLVQVIKDPDFLSESGFNPLTVSALFLPNTYELYWNTSAEQFLRRMHKEYQRFWNEERKQKAGKLGFSPEEVATLASIVQKETAKEDEQPRVAGLYINRIRDGWKLQSDPTVIYGIKLGLNKDTLIRRVLYSDLKYDSPFNTYLYKGLPPAPICIPSINAVDAILNYEKHTYYYMCASVKRPGYHNFARTSNQHARNKRIYTNWLREQGIRR